MAAFRGRVDATSQEFRESVVSAAQRGCAVR